MKRTLFIASIFFLLLGSTTGFAQKFDDLDLSPMDVEFIRDSNNAPMIRIIYSRPQRRGRKIFGGLVPYDQVWRTGANEATEITFYEDMTVFGKHIDEGTYTLFTIPHKDRWTIILNEAIHIWGTNYDKTKDVLRFKIPVEKTPAPVEVFSMSFQPTNNGANLLMGWENVYVRIPFKKA